MVRSGGLESGDLRTFEKIVMGIRLRKMAIMITYFEHNFRALQCKRY